MTPHVAITGEDGTPHEIQLSELQAFASAAVEDQQIGFVEDRASGGILRTGHMDAGGARRHENGRRRASDGDLRGGQRLTDRLLRSGRDCGKRDDRECDGEGSSFHGSYWAFAAAWVFSSVIRLRASSRY